VSSTSETTERYAGVGRNPESDHALPSCQLVSLVNVGICFYGLDWRADSVFGRTTCASTVVAMHIEIALSPSFASPQRRASRTHIHNGLAYLRASSEHWQRVQWTLRMFEVVVARTGLSLGGPDHSDFDVTSMSPFAQTRSNMSDERNDSSKTSSDYNIVTGVDPIPEAPNSAWSGLPSDTWSDVANADLLCEPMMIDEDPEKWLNELIAENVFGKNIMQPGTR
jgi:hypothetical protein